MHDTDNQQPHYPRPLEAQVERVITPFTEFIRNQTTGSILLIICSFGALLIANSEYANDYQALTDLHAGFVLGDHLFSMSLKDWINDGLMSAFFFVLGLEIKREVLVGELKNPRTSLPVIAAALGGMLTPAVIYYLFNTGTDFIHGWGIPMATDSAFAVGVLALLGRRIPVGLLTFLTALAIIDDLGAIMVIAVFYASAVNLVYLGLALLLLAILAACNAFGCRHPGVYFVGGLFVWLAILASGLHATLAGVLVAMIVPARPKRNAAWFVSRAQRLIDKFKHIDRHSTRPILGETSKHKVIEEVQDSAEKASTPLRRWERTLETPVALLVMPIFALVNAGIPVHLDSLSDIWTHPLGLGIILGLVVGKLTGIFLMSWLALRLRLGRLPQAVNMRHIFGIGLLGGMGFTMSIFVAGLGFESSPQALVDAKLSIFLASLIAGLAGYLWLLLLSGDTSAAENEADD
ncbi:MAG: Na+/H+ antiporter NhaA [Gammaproteobacteria bacterium]